MARRGRPPATDSAETRQGIIDVARAEFADRGFAAAAITTIADRADLAPSAIYHYFGGKADLYEAVFEDTSAAIWGDIEATTVQYGSLVEAVDALIDDARHLHETRPHHNDFLANVPVEARLHAPFAHLLNRRSKYQDEVFGALAELGLATGELAGLDHDHATEVIRATIMGWFFERHFRGAEIDHGGEAIKTLFRLLADR